MVYDIRYNNNINLEVHYDRGILSVKSNDNILDLLDEVIVEELERKAKSIATKERIVKFIIREFLDCNPETYSDRIREDNILVNKISAAILSDRLTL